MSQDVNKGEFFFLIIDYYVTATRNSNNLLQKRECILQFLNMSSGKYIVMMQMGAGPGSWIKAFGPSDFNTCQWWASNQSKPTQVVPA